MKENKTIGFTRSLTYKYLVILVCALSCMFTSMPSILATVDEYNPQYVTIQIKDGGNAIREERVLKGSVEEVLNQLYLGLGSQDLVNMDLTEIVEEGDLIEITRINYIETSMQDIIEPETDIVYNGLHLFNTSVVSEGQAGIIQKHYSVMYQNGQEVEAILTKEEVIQEPVNAVIAQGAVQPGAYFSGKLTTYGLDCYGCSGNTAAGVNLAALGKATYTYKGQEYYILAADRSIPMYSIIKITNHKLGLPETIYGIVLDRGGAIKGNIIDIYCGREYGERFFSGGTSYGTEFEIISVGR